MAQLTCIVVTPEKTAVEAVTDFVVVPLYDGELGIAPGHSPMIGRLGYGELRLGRGEKAERYYVDGGFVQVLNDTVSVLTNRAMLIKDIDEEVAHEQLRHAIKRPILTKEQQDIRDRLVAQARAQIRLAKGRS
jgi:F-type H+-transporting ATPase subunit epsilon